MNYSETEICAVIAASGLFDVNYYLQKNEDVRKSCMDPILHYVRYGEQEGRKPAANLDLKVQKNYLFKNRLFNYIKNIDEGTSKIIIPVIFAVNDNYIPCLSVAIASLIYHSSYNYLYNLYIFYNKISKESLEIIKSMETENVKIYPLNVSKYVGEIIEHAYVSGHASAETYFRILIPKLLNEFPKVVYLDGDIILNQDIVNLYNINIDNYLIAAAEETITTNMRKCMPEYIDEFYNAGILLINVENFIKFNIYDAFMELVKGDVKYSCWDQPILNIVCYKKVLPLEMTWNFQWQYYAKSSYKKSDNIVFKKYAMHFANPAIVHYNSDLKPWNHDDGYFARMFWKYAKLSPLFDKICESCTYPLDEILKSHELESINEVHGCPIR